MGGRRSASFKPFALKLERGRRAEAMHNSGFTYEQIGTALNVSAMSAWRWVQFCADWDARGREPNGRRSRKIPRYRNTRGQPPKTQRVRRTRGGGELPATGRWAPRDIGWMATYCAWCTYCREHYARGRPCCPRCGRPPERR